MVDELIGGTFFNDFCSEAQIADRSEICEIFFVKSRFFSKGLMIALCESTGKLPDDSETLTSSVNETRWGSRCILRSHVGCGSKEQVEFENFVITLCTSPLDNSLKLVKGGQLTVWSLVCKSVFILALSILSRILVIFFTKKLANSLLSCWGLSWVGRCLVRLFRRLLTVWNTVLLSASASLPAK